MTSRALPSLLLAAAMLVGCSATESEGADESSAASTVDPASPVDGIVMFAYGGIPVPYVPVADIAKMRAKVSAVAEKENKKIAFEVFGPYGSRSICSRVRELVGARTQHVPLVLVGHSFGAGAVLDASECLANEGEGPPLTIDELVTVDPFRLARAPGTKEIVTDNVANNVNLFQETGLLRGNQNHRRTDGTSRGIENRRGAEGHIQIMTTAVDDGTVGEAIDRALAPAR